MIRPLMERAFRAYEAKDREAALAVFAEDAVLIDPHYPEPRIEGRAALAEGMDWAFEAFASLGFSIRTFIDGGAQAAVEVDSHHVLADGTELRFPQLFLVEAEGGRITEIRAYQMYGPPTG